MFIRKEGASANFIDHEWVSFCHSLQTYQLWLEGTRQLLTWNHSVEFANPKTPSCFFAHLLQCILHCCHPPVVHCLRHPSSFRGEAPQGYSWSGRHSMEAPTKKAIFERPAKHQARHLDRCRPLTLTRRLGGTQSRMLIVELWLVWWERCIYIWWEHVFIFRKV